MEPVPVPEPQVAAIDWREYSHVHTAHFVALNLGFKEGGDYGTVECTVTAYAVELEQSGLFQRTFVNFTLAVARQGRHWTVYRRFSQFVDFDTKLRHHRLIPHDSSATLPDKTGMKRVTEPEFVTARMEALQRYLHTVLAIAAVRNSETVYTFLGPFQLQDERGDFFAA